MPSLSSLKLTNLTLQQKVGLVVLTGLVVGLGLFSWLGIRSLAQSTARVLDERLTIARIEAGRLDETLTHVLVHLELTADFGGSLPSEDDFVASCRPLREMLGRLGITARSLLLVDGNGRVVWVEPRQPDMLGADLSGHDEVLETLRSGASAVSGLAHTPLGEEPVVLATTPVRDEAGAVIGVLAAAIDVEATSQGAFGSLATVGETGYIEIVDGNGMVITRTRPGSPASLFETSDHPARFAELIQQQKATVGTCHRCHGDSKSPERRRDVLAFATLSTASWGVAVRQSEEEALAPTRELERRMVLLGTVVIISTSLTLWIVMQGIVSPIRMLTSAAKSVAAGKFDTLIPVKRKDDIGQLSNAFRTMTRELAKSRNELLRRNEELSALNSIATTVTQSLNLQEVLESALSKVLEVTRTTAGCVFLRAPDADRLKMMSHFGPSQFFECQQADCPEADCACHQVLQEGQTLMVNDVSQCPILEEFQVMGSGSFFVSVPLKYKNRTLGIMNIASPGDRYFTEYDFRLLDSIGHHVGLAIENSILYEDAKQKEVLRGQMLSGVINAQEEERKRIARELHDEYGQTLTGLIMSIESVANSIPPEQSKFAERLSHLKSFAVRALDSMRKMTLDLRPSTLDDLGLAATVRSYLHANLEAMGIRATFQNRTRDTELAPEVETALFRIIQEAVHNITKYAEASHVKVLLEAKDGRIRAVVEDNGRGFDVDTVYSSRIGAHSLGLRGIQERATLLGGTFEIVSQIGKGTRLTVEIPLTHPGEESGLAGQGLSQPGGGEARPEA